MGRGNEQVVPSFEGVMGPDLDTEANPGAG